MESNSNILLLHQCCAPCSIYPVKRLTGNGIKIFGYFYNPNIHPYTEFFKRLEYLVKYNKTIDIEYEIDNEYDVISFINQVSKYKNRCEGCYRLRLSRAARFAKKNGFTYYTSSLLYSRRQKHEIIKAIGEEYAQETGVQFLYEDYRDGWQEGIQVSKQMCMYRQNYCGCIMSEQERFKDKLAF